jgi:hypothetical protein
MNAQKTGSRALVLAIGMSIATISAWAQMPANARQSTSEATTKAPGKSVGNDDELLKFSHEGNLALQDIRAARFAVFDGKTSEAEKLMEDANAAIARAEKEAPEFTSTNSTRIDGKLVATSSTRREAVSVPVDGQLMIADDFVMTPEKKVHVDNANENLKNGSHSKAVEELRLGDIDVNYTRLWMPMASSRERLEQAIKLTRDGKFYEANLALKAIEDNLFVDSVNINELPKKPRA